MHKQVFIKVNAPVDEGVAELVKALSLFPKLITIESCEGFENSPARIFFTYGELRVSEQNWTDGAKFILQFLGPRLWGKLGDRVCLKVYPRYVDRLDCCLAVPKDVMHRTVVTIKGIRRQMQ